MISTTTIVALAGIGVGVFISESVLNKIGKIEEAKYINLVGISALGTSALAQVIKLFQALANL